MTNKNIRIMTEREFVIWLRGYSKGVHHYNLTPLQWDYLKEQLDNVILDNKPYVETEGENISTTWSV
tara:strand:+ start:983 stop:1183 length:201 start_codon:yes stop_codon:yes gene_type:complete